jgi:hypothetical protein
MNFHVWIFAAENGLTERINSILYHPLSTLHFNWPRTHKNGASRTLEQIN